MNKLDDAQLLIQNQKFNEAHALLKTLESEISFDQKNEYFEKLIYSLKELKKENELILAYHSYAKFLKEQGDRKKEYKINKKIFDHLDLLSPFQSVAKFLITFMDDSFTEGEIELGEQVYKLAADRCIKRKLVVLGFELLKKYELHFGPTASSDFYKIQLHYILGDHEGCFKSIKSLSSWGVKKIGKGLGMKKWEFAETVDPIYQWVVDHGLRDSKTDLIFYLSNNEISDYEKLKIISECIALGPEDFENCSLALEFFYAKKKLVVSKNILDLFFEHMNEFSIKKSYLRLWDKKLENIRGDRKSIEFDETKIIQTKLLSLGEDSADDLFETAKPCDVVERKAEPRKHWFSIKDEMEKDQRSGSQIYQGLVDNLSPFIESDEDTALWDKRQEKTLINLFLAGEKDEFIASHREYVQSFIFLEYFDLVYEILDKVDDAQDFDKDYLKILSDVKRKDYKLALSKIEVYKTQKALKRNSLHALLLIEVEILKKLGLNKRVKRVSEELNRLR